MEDGRTLRFRNRMLIERVIGEGYGMLDDFMFTYWVVVLKREITFDIVFIVNGMNVLF